MELAIFAIMFVGFAAFRSALTSRLSSLWSSFGGAVTDLTSDMERAGWLTPTSPWVTAHYSVSVHPHAIPEPLTATPYIGPLQGSPQVFAPTAGHPYFAPESPLCPMFVAETLHGMPTDAAILAQSSECASVGNDYPTADDSPEDVHEVSDDSPIIIDPETLDVVASPPDILPRIEPLHRQRTVAEVVAGWKALPWSKFREVAQEMGVKVKGGRDHMLSLMIEKWEERNRVGNVG